MTLPRARAPASAATHAVLGTRIVEPGPSSTSRSREAAPREKAGSLITQASGNANFPLLAAGVLTMSLALVALNRTVWRRLYRLADERFSLNR